MDGWLHGSKKRKMTKQEIIKYSLIGLFAIGGLLILLTFFKRNNNGIDYKELLKAKDETIQAVTRERDVYRQWKDDAINELQKKDSVLQLKIKTNTMRYEKIPVTVSNYSDDELRSAVENYR